MISEVNLNKYAHGIVPHNREVYMSLIHHVKHFLSHDTMIHRTAPSVLTLIIALSIAGCTGSTGPAGPSLTGSMTGFVTLFQSDGSRASDHSGVIVCIQGTSRSAMTDSTGKWTISGVSTGTYNVTYTKQSYGMSEQQGVQFVGGDIACYAGKIIMAQPPFFLVALDPVKTIADSNALYVSFTTAGVAKGIEIAFLIAVGTDSSVSASDPTKYLYSAIFTNVSNSGAANVFASTLGSAGFTSGTPAYVVAYPLCYYNGGFEYSSYLDHATGRTGYTSLGAASSVIRLIVP